MELSIAPQDAVEAVELDRLVRDIETEMTALGHAMTIDHLDTVSVKVCALGLRRALRNLIVNAAMHGKGCIVSLTGQGGRAVLTIADRCPGIPPDLLNKAFEPFFRVDPARTQFIPGAGLGLAIAKEIVERYGGQSGWRTGGGWCRRWCLGRFSSGAPVNSTDACRCCSLDLLDLRSRHLVSCRSRRAILALAVQDWVLGWGQAILPLAMNRRPFWRFFHRSAEQADRQRERATRLLGRPWPCTQARSEAISLPPPRLRASRTLHFRVNADSRHPRTTLTARFHPCSTRMSPLNGSDLVRAVHGVFVGNAGTPKGNETETRFRFWPGCYVAGLSCLVAEKSRSLNMQRLNQRELIIQLSGAYRLSTGNGDARLLPN
ncbi:sensor histidine kinase [Mesorhizobium dulcispinae]|uniref:sensor histidine kinase n=1 Tax=Mesorhizobium dulcispinae TaxID=3072316 RepID=UPI002A23EA80|nr:HAMP domain-containing sensor histidine kinase [Mesorhizobium sp. VK23D]MDX8521318.1 HAMP domain-containing sensor histidine kinase [Mesorhizobium sp. VK23D]